MHEPTTAPDAVKQAILAGRKIEAIKLHRELTGLGLKESKDAVEKLETELRQSEPHRFDSSVTRSGCFSTLVLGVLGLTALTFFLLAGPR